MYKRKEAVDKLRDNLRKKNPSIGSWMQLASSSVAEIMGQAGYDWVAIDLEHGAISLHQLPDLFRALELGGTIPLARIAQGHIKDCKEVLDAGAGGIIVPMIESAEQLIEVRDACCWPPAGTRGVGFSRANLFGKQFIEYTMEAQSPLLVAMIENIHAVENLEKILAVNGLDAILIGPYDLSASMQLTAQFEEPAFKSTLRYIFDCASHANIPCGIHVVEPNHELLHQYITQGYCFIAYSIDAVFLHNNAKNPIQDAI